MIVRALGAVAAAGLALSPVAASAAPGPNPDTLRAALADQFDTTLIEVDVGAAGTLDGPFDTKTYAQYFQAYGQDENSIQLRTRTLEQNDFVGGYGRQWYRPGTPELLFESILVFKTSQGASSIGDGFKFLNAQLPGFESFIDPRLNQGSWGLNASTGAFHVTMVGFEKRNALFTITRWSAIEGVTSETLAQARNVYDQAPDGISLPGAVNARSVSAPNIQLNEVAALGLLVAAETVLVVVLLLVVALRRRAAPRLEARSGP